MSSIVVRCINNLVMILAIILTTQSITNKKVNLFSIRTIFWICVTFLPCFLFLESGYNFVFTMLSFSFFSFSLKNIFQFDILKGMIISIDFIIISIIPDLLISFILGSFFNYDQIKSSLILMTTSNLLVSIITSLLLCLPFFKRLIVNSFHRIIDSNHKNSALYAIMSFIAIGMIYYIAIALYRVEVYYMVTNIIILIFIFLVFAYMIEIIKYDQLKIKNDTLYECMKNIENYQEKQDLRIHEYKNQLSKLTALTTDEKIIDKIEEILDVDLTADTYLLGKIKNVPKGELKSLIYYKLLVAKRENVNISIDVSSDLTDENYRFNKKQEKSLSHLIGISFDNAIEAAKDSKEKELFLEIYETSVGMTFSITNTFSGVIDTDKIGQLGYTTKGENHGKGLHFMKKIVEERIGLYTRTMISEKYFTQKIIINKKTDK